MAKGIVSQIMFNVPKTSKAGKAYNVIQLKFTTEKGQSKTESIFESASFAGVLKTLAPGDEIEATYVKNGEFFNLTDVKLLNKGAGVAPAPQAGASKGYTAKVEDPEKQASIQRQNALTNATTLVTAMLSQEMFKKTTKPAILIQEIISIATAFEGYTSGRDKLAKLESTVADVTASGDVPFDTDEFPE